MDGLRGIAISLVLLFHWLFNSGYQPNSTVLSAVWRVGGISWSGVDLFFVLSGFLIGGILLDARDSPRYFRTFYLRRAFRILPLYGLVVSLYVLYVARPFPFHALNGQLAEFSPSALRMVSYVTFTQNFWMAYLGTWGSIPMAATWSLAVEEQFYLTAPLIVRMLTRSRLRILLVSIVIIAPILRILLYFSFRNGAFADYVLMPCRADGLCLGVLCALLVRNSRFWNLLLAKRKLLQIVTGILFGGVIGLAAKRYGQTAGPMVTGGYSLLALFYTGCLLLALTGKGAVNRFLCLRPLMDLGGIAYCTYLLHMPVMEACRRFVGAMSRHSSGTEFLGGLLGIALTLGIAKLSWRFLEYPMLRRGHKYSY